MIWLLKKFKKFYEVKGLQCNIELKGFRGCDLLDCTILFRALEGYRVFQASARSKEYFRMKHFGAGSKGLGLKRLPGVGFEGVRFRISRVWL